MDREDVEYLFKKYYTFQGQIRYLDEQIAKMEARATKKTQTFQQDPNRTPITNPRPSKVEKNAIKLAELRKQREDVSKLWGEADRLFKMLRPHQRYLVKCCVCNKMPYKEFAKREGISVQNIRDNFDRIYKKFENE